MPPSLSQNALLPAGFRQKDQTTKAATGPFDREHLLSYLEKQALEHKDREDFVPFTGEKKGTIHPHLGVRDGLPGHSRPPGWPFPGAHGDKSGCYCAGGGAGVRSRAVAAADEAAVSSATQWSALLPWSYIGRFKQVCGWAWRHTNASPAKGSASSCRIPKCLCFQGRMDRGGHAHLTGAISMLSISPVQGWCSGGGVQEEMKMPF